ncbi:ATP-binding protein [Psychrobacter lutiphocae]|uniref:ATP-binding protein n=1 Tax=Psychrobacter lutiphocae TaxID=540500 RepID=UPI000379158E|nr:ATP-binding protein [Psychrobacter lutiphocae]
MPTATAHNISNTSNLNLVPQSQIRLAKLSLFNWGSFHGLHHANIDPEGTLITGDNGSGKSTLIDGLMALLMPAGRATFNVAAAQNDKSDRSLITYMRGSFGSAHDGANTRVKSKRDKGVITGLSADYVSDDGNKITLLALFWTTLASNALSDVKRLYVVAQKELPLADVLDHFAQGNVRKLKQWLGSQPEVTCCDDNFSDYQQLYRRMLYMDNPNAPALLSRALGLKKIDDLTDLIRTLVLEPSSVRDDAKEIVKEFADLVAIHSRLQDAKEQVTHLERLPELAQNIASTEQIINELKAQKSALPIYFAEQYALLYTQKCEEITQELVSLERELNALQQQEIDAGDTVQLRRDEYMKLGGNRIDSLKKDIQSTKDSLTRINDSASRYQTLCRELNIDTSLDEASFDQNLVQAVDSEATLSQQKQDSERQFGDSAIALNDIQKKHQDIQQEITALKNQPNSNIPPKFVQLKDNISQSLDIDPDTLMFIGELIDIKDEEQHWQGAIERALGGLKTTLLVPQASYSLITKWLNAQHTGLHVRVQVVANQHATNHTHTEFKTDGYLRKLKWRTHTYRDWLKQFLNRHDLRCVENTAQLDNTPFSMTQQGLIHKEKGRFDKKDLQHIDDRRHWQLGFSNKAKLDLLQADEQTLKAELKDFSKRWEQARDAMNDVGKQLTLWAQLQQFTWENINVPYWQQKLEREQQELDAIKNAQGDLKQAELRWEVAKDELAKISKQIIALNTQKGAKEQELKVNRKHLEDSQTIIKNGHNQGLINDDIRKQLDTIIYKAGNKTGKNTLITLDDTTLQTQTNQRLEDDISLNDTRLNRNKNSAIGIMSSFKAKPQWQAYTVEWATGLDGLSDHIEHLTQLNEEGLPELLDEFKQRLNKHATQSLARLRNRLMTVHDEIRGRIDHINNVLKKTEFRQNSHLKLSLKRENYPQVTAFDQTLNQALSAVNDNDHEKRFYLLKQVIDILDKATASASANTLESLRLLDPRYQLAFYAEEIDIDTQDVLDVLSSSSGKSGGEKESFAGMIVAASLAYVLTPDGADKPIYSTVFLDEAFSNTAEQVSRRVLKVFKKLHIHVNLITPFKNLNLARDSARSLLIAERNQQHHESSLCEVTWEEIDNIMAKKNTDQLAQDGIRLG